MKSGDSRYAAPGSLAETDTFQHVDAIVTAFLEGARQNYFEEFEIVIESLKVDESDTLQSKGIVVMTKERPVCNH